MYTIRKIILMKKISIFYLTLDLNYNVLDYNEELSKFFDVKQSILNYPETLAILNRLKPQQEQAALILTNQENDLKSAMFILYANIYRAEHGYTLKMVNWLNWLHNLHESTEHGYASISEVNNSPAKFSKISKLSCFKALYPLLMHIPNKFKNNSSAFYEILRVFLDKDNPSAYNNYNKDYARNVRSRLQTAIKTELGLTGIDLLEIIKDDKLLNLDHQNEMYIPNTSLIENAIYCVENNDFLNYFMAIPQLVKYNNIKSQSGLYN